MKNLSVAIALAACVFMRVGSAWAADTIRVISADAPRVSAVNGRVDIFQARTGAGRLISLYGYNAGAQAFVELFDTTNGPTISISGFNATADYFTNSSGGLALGDAVQITSTFAGNAAGIYWVAPGPANSVATLSNVFQLYTSRAAALVAALPVAEGFPTPVDLTGATATATFNRVPFHSFAVAATDNYSCIVPTTGIPYGRGLLICTSTTAGTYTAGGTNITVCATIASP